MAARGQGSRESSAGIAHLLTGTAEAVQRAAPAPVGTADRQHGAWGQQSFTLTTSVTEGTRKEKARVVMGPWLPPNSPSAAVRGEGWAGRITANRDFSGCPRALCLTSLSTCHCSHPACRVSDAASQNPLFFSAHSGNGHHFWSHQFAQPHECQHRTVRRPQLRHGEREDESSSQWIYKAAF